MDILDGILVFLPLWCVTDGLRLDFWVFPVACIAFFFISAFLNPMLSGLVTAVLWIGGLVVCIMYMKTWFIALYVVAGVPYRGGCAPGKESTISGRIFS